MWIIYQKKKKFTPQPNRVPWAHPVQCQPHERWTTLGVNSERTLMGQRLPETFPKGSQSVKKVANLLGPVCSNSFEDLIQWFPIRCNLPLRQYLAMCETLLVVTTWWMGGQTGIQWAEIRDAAQHCIEQPPYQSSGPTHQQGHSEATLI